MKEELSRKTILHNEVLDKILDMLGNKEILHQNVPIENIEKNARLIKSFLYKEISNKYPKLNSYNKILRINQLKKNELFIIFDQLPDLNEYSNIIENNIKNRKNNIIKKKYIETTDVTETEITNITETEATNTIETETTNRTEKNNILEIINDLPLDNNSTYSTNSNIINNVIKLIKNVVIVYSFYKLFNFIYN